MTSIAQTPHTRILFQKIANSLSDKEFKKSVASLRVSAAYCNPKIRHYIERQWLKDDFVAVGLINNIYKLYQKAYLTGHFNFSRGLLHFFQQMQ